MRVKYTGYIILVILLALSARIFYISVIEGKKLAAASVSQSVQNVVKSPVRGIIYDRNMIKITDADKTVLDIDGMDPIYVSKRYNDGLLSHLVGYMSESGGFGIEKAFDDILKSKDFETVSVTQDARQNIVPRFGYRQSTHEIYSGIKLTVDYHIQKIVENAMDNHKINGAVVMVNAKTGEILAMASRPNFRQDKLADYLDSTEGELINRAVCQYNPGSIFKILIACAALENGYTEEIGFYCPGKVDINGQQFVCNKEEGHGQISFYGALAYSCNCAFYEMGQQIGMDAIYETAKKFGFGSEVLNINKLYESKGIMPYNKSAPPQEIANISIGQGDVMVTPLQVADMLCTIANDGERKQLTLIKGLVDDEGNSRDLKPVTIDKVISVETARRVYDGLVCGVQFGTCTGAYIEGMGAAGKTGSAETGWMKDGELMTHGWFAGLFPEKDPQYICVVLAENGKRGSDSAVPVFKEIGEKMKTR